MSDSSVGELQLADYLNIVNRRKVTIAALVVTTLILAIVLSALQTPQFRASARVRVEVGSTDTLDDQTNTSTSVRARNLQNEVEFANSDRVALAAAESFGEAISAGVAASTDSDTLVFTVVDTSAERAADIANTFAGSYVSERTNSATERFTGAADIITERLVSLAAERSELQEQRNVEGADLSAISNQIAALDTEEARLRGELNQLDVISQLNTTTSVSVLNAAEAPGGAFSPSWVRNIGLALVAGLVLGLGVALVQESLDNTILSKRSLEKAMDGVPILGMIPTPHKNRFSTKRERRLITSRTGGFTEAFRSLHSSIELGQAGSNIRSILVTSPNASEGKSTVAAHLAIAFARSGASVIVIDADMHNPSQHGLWAVPNEKGLADQLSNLGNAEIVTEEASGEGLISIIPAGSSALPPAELLRSVAAAEFIEKLSYAYDLVIIDSPPLRPVADTLPLARVADATLLVALRGQTDATEVEEAVEMLARAQTRPLGGILNGADEGAGYGYGYGYGKQGGRNRS